ncbi:MAG: UDP-N-acetylmuramate dehydrogenase [Candidatus Competibacterales bacterium]
MAIPTDFFPNPGLSTPSFAPRGQLLENEPLAGYTSWRVGGPARRLYRPRDAADLAAFLAHLPPTEPLLWLGLGSNVLVRDGGFPGTVLVLHGGVSGLDRVDGGLWVEAGVPWAKVARTAGRFDLAGAEFLVGIPGTVGGALAMNAGAWGGEIWPLVAWVETLDRRGRRRRRTPDQFAIGYRQVIGPPGEWFVGARLALGSGCGAASRARMRELLLQRAATQPTGVKSCGSVFKNPPGDHAARLIDQAHLKGLRLGGALVSPRHANFILNDAHASAADLEALMHRVAAAVERRSGVALVPEVRIVGRPTHEGAG